ncbi:MAG: hypothetical protein QM635_01630 [Microbacteriaceae bacterium]
MIRAALLLSPVLIALALSGCTGGDADESGDATSSATVASATPDASATAATDDATDDGTDDAEATPTADSASYADASALVDAAVAAGLSCASPTTVDAEAPATSAVKCGKLTLSVYASADDRDSVVNTALADADSTAMFLVGANWIIAAPNGNSGTKLSALLDVLGGFIVPEGS